MRSQDGNPLWKYSTQGETLTSKPAFDPELNEIAIVRYDLLFIRLDATTGKLKRQNDSNGRGLFSEVTAYGRGYLVVVNMNGYRENDKSAKLNRPTLDRLEYWADSEEQSWSMDFPLNAQLIVDGKRIFCLRRSKDKLRLQELHFPRGQPDRSRPT